jgi:hypothetical protein
MTRSLCAAFSVCAWIFALANAATACSLIKIAEMPLIQLGNHYAVMANVANQNKPMIVDTGSAVTLLGSKTTEALKLAEDYSGPPPKPVLGIGQVSAELHRNVIVPTLAFGNLTFHDRSTVVASLDFGPSPENAAAGLLGDDILSNYDVEFDFLAGSLTFYDEFECYDTFLPWLGTYSTLPFSHRGAKISVDLFLDGERSPAIVDTGNNKSFVSRAASALWTVRNDELKNTRWRSTSPLNGGTTSPDQKYKFDKIRIGDEVFTQEYMNVIPVQLQGISANLGLDYWKNRKLWISYPNNLIFISKLFSSPKLAYPVKANSPHALAKN